MRFTLTHKYVGSLFGALITCCVVVLFVSIHYMKEPIEEELDGNIRRMQNVMRITNEITAMRFAQSAALLAREERLTRAVVVRDYEQIMSLSEKAMQETGADFMTVTNAEGIVLGRGHSKKRQDSVLNQETVAKALQGSPSVAVVARNRGAVYHSRQPTYQLRRQDPGHFVHRKISGRSPLSGLAEKVERHGRDHFQGVMPAS